MLDPDNKIDANSTWEPPPRKQWLFKFIASLALFGFLIGMMIGRLLEEPQQLITTKRIVQVQSFADGLGVCLTGPTKVQSHTVQGSYQVLLLDSWGQAAQGEILLTGVIPVRWQLQPDGGMMRIAFIGLQDIAGQWRQRMTDEGYWCADIKINVREE